MNNYLNINIFENNPDVVLNINKNGVISKKIISIDTLISSISSNYNISTGILPKGTRFFNGCKTKYTLGIETPATTKIISIVDKLTKDEKKIMLPIPICFFIFKIKNDKVFDSYVYALKNSLFSNKDKLFRFPYCNTYSDGRICWGEVKLGKVMAPITTTILINQFFDSKFNGDLFDSSILDFKDMNIKIPYFEDLIGFLTTKEKFPTDFLTTSSYKNLESMEGSILNE